MKTEALSAFASKIAVGVATAATLALAGQLTALARMCELCRPAGSKAPKQPLELRSVLSAGCSLPLNPA